MKASTVVIKNKLKSVIKDYKKEKIELPQLRQRVNSLLADMIQLDLSDPVNDQLYWLLDELDDIEYNLRNDPEKAGATLKEAFQFAKVWD